MSKNLFKFIKKCQNVREKFMEIIFDITNKVLPIPRCAAQILGCSRSRGRRSRRSETAENMKHAILIDVKTILLSILRHFMVLLMPSTIFYNTQVHKIKEICKTRQFYRKNMREKKNQNFDHQHKKNFCGSHLWPRPQTQPQKPRSCNRTSGYGSNCYKF